MATIVVTTVVMATVVIETVVITNIFWHDSLGINNGGCDFTFGQNFLLVQNSSFT